jgi:F-type H+-transporting ATPase subunit a
VAAEGSNSIDALGQFQLHPALGFIGESVNFTQANLMMIIASLGVLGLLWIGMKPRAMVPGRLQAAAELGYETILSMCLEQIGPEGRRFFPMVFPYFFTFTSHIAVTLALSLLVFILVTTVAIKEHGWHFFSYFVPQGIPMVLAPLLVVIEVISYLSRIISLSVRLFANMMAGHVMLEVFGAFIVMLGGLGLLGYIPAGLSLGLNTILIGFELLVAILQAYVFAVLTCIYLHDAVHLH